MALHERLGEVILPLITPFDGRGELHLAALDRLTAFVIERKFCDSLFVGGTTGEFHALTTAERVQLLERVKQTAGGRVPLIAGTGTATTRETVYLTGQAERLRYDAVAVVLPYYSRPTQEEIYRHFVAVAQSTKLPVILYNIPLFTGVNLMPQTLARLAELPNVVGVKDQAGANPVQTSEYLRVAPHLAVYCGDDAMILQVLAQGGVGAVSGGAHAVGDLIKEMIRLFKSGAVQEATRLHHRLIPFHRALTPDGRANPIPCIREAVHLVSGIDVGPPRPPLLPPGEDAVAQLQLVLNRLARPHAGQKAER